MKTLPPGQRAKLAAARSGRNRATAESDASRQRTAAKLVECERAYRAGAEFVQPSRITVALDIRSLYGPAVDIACLAVEPAVDEWEAGKAAPTWEQLLALAELTEFSPLFFFAEPLEWPGGGFLCTRSGKGKGCHPITPRAAIEPYMPPALVESLAGQGVLFAGIA